MTDPYISSSFYMIEMLISYIFYLNTSERRISNKRIIIIGILLFQIVSIFNIAFKNNIFVNMSVLVLVNFLFAMICFKMNLKEAAFFACVLTGASGLTEIVAIFAVSALTESTVRDYNYSFRLFIVEYPVSKMLYFTETLIMAFVMKRKNYKLRIPFVLLLYPAACLCCVYIFWSIGNADDTGAGVKGALTVASIVLCTATIILFIVWEYYSGKEMALMLAEKQIERMETEKNYYDILEEQNKKLLSYAHDAKKHLAAIQNITSDKRINEYIEKLTGQISDYSSGCRSGNKLLDVIVERYITQTKLHNINMEYDIKRCNFQGVDDIDLVVILGNLLDNAFNAAQESEEKQIKMVTKKVNAYSVIIITNSCHTKPFMDNEKHQTVVKENRIHGIGLKNVEKVLGKYQGSLDWTYKEEKKEFIMTVMLIER